MLGGIRLPAENNVRRAEGGTAAAQLDAGNEPTVVLNVLCHRLGCGLSDCCLPLDRSHSALELRSDGFFFFYYFRFD